MAKTDAAAPSDVNIKTSKMIGGGHVAEASREARGSKKKHIRSIQTTRGKNGGHVLEHNYEHGNDMGYSPSTQHIFGKGEGVKHVEHYIRHAGIKGVKAMAAGDGMAEGEGAADDAGEKGAKD